MPDSHQRLYMHGKLLLAGEYFVLDGATALAAPTRFGQTFEFLARGQGDLMVHWKGLNHEGKPWLNVVFSGSDFKIEETDSAIEAERLRQLLIIASRKSRKRLQGEMTVISRLEFPRDWGLGSSSTLVVAVAEWLGVEPIALNQEVFGGSGYDVACAKSENAILFNVTGRKPLVRDMFFAPRFSENILFVHLGKKQDSRAGIAHYRSRPKPDKMLLSQVSYYSEMMAVAYDMESFQMCIDALEELTARHLGLPPVKHRFPDFEGSIKSLGAWGGDFIMVVSPQGREYMSRYFRAKGFNTLVSYEEMIL